MAPFHFIRVLRNIIPNKKLWSQNLEDCLCLSVCWGRSSSSGYVNNQIRWRTRMTKRHRDISLFDRVCKLDICHQRGGNVVPDTWHCMSSFRAASSWSGDVRAGPSIELADYDPRSSLVSTFFFPSPPLPAVRSFHRPPARELVLITLRGCLHSDHEQRDFKERGEDGSAFCLENRDGFCSQ